MEYKQAEKEAMKMLSQHPKTIFLGQTVKYDGSPMFRMLEDVPDDKKIELPVFEDTQMGMSIGLALSGFIPISIYPRWDFLILATNQLVNHLDKLKSMSHGEFNPKMIIITRVGNKEPLDPGPQHTGDYTEVFRHFLVNINLFKVSSPNEIMSIYKTALNSKKSSIIVHTTQQATKEEIESRKA
jgi:pyruvate/2-oxoglutarate/acetoin dehydrogenase E1 component